MRGGGRGTRGGALTDWIDSQVGLGGVLGNSDAILVAGHDSEVVLNARRHICHLEAGFLQVLRALGPGLPVHLTFLHNIVEDRAAAVILWWQPGQLSCRLGDVGCLQAANGTRSICKGRIWKSFCVVS